MNVRYTDITGNRRFGTIQKEFESGKTIVADLLTGLTNLLPKSRLTEVPFDINAFGKHDKEMGLFWGGNDLNDYIALENMAHEIRDLRNPAGVHKNTLFHCAVGDGSASYVVTDSRSASCTIAWRGFCPDRWVHHIFGYGGSFRKKDVARLVFKAANTDVDAKLATFRNRYADYVSRFAVVPVGMEDLI